MFRNNARLNKSNACRTRTVDSLVAAIQFMLNHRNEDNVYITNGVKADYGFQHIAKKWYDLLLRLYADIIFVQCARIDDLHQACITNTLQEFVEKKYGPVASQVRVVVGHYFTYGVADIITEYATSRVFDEFVRSGIIIKNSNGDVLTMSKSTPRDRDASDFIADADDCMIQ